MDKKTVECNNLLMEFTIYYAEKEAMAIKCKFDKDKGIKNPRSCTQHDKWQRESAKLAQELFKKKCVTD